MTIDETDRLAEQLCGVWYSSLVRYAARLTGSVELAQDLAQEAFLLLFRALRAGKVIEFPKAWTLRVVKRQASRQLRYEKDRGIVFEPIEHALHVTDATAPVPPLDGQGLDEFSRLIALLTTREEEVLLLRLEGLRYREIAAELDISIGTVKTLLSRAVVKIQAAIRPDITVRFEDIYEDRATRRPPE